MRCLFLFPWVCSFIAKSKIVFFYFSARRKANKKFKVRICDDVLIGILSFGRRRHFSMLEPHGTRFKYFIERYWPEAPLLILDMDCWKYEKVDDKVLIPDSIPFWFGCSMKILKDRRFGSFLFKQIIGREDWDGSKPSIPINSNHKNISTAFLENNDLAKSVKLPKIWPKAKINRCLLAAMPS